MPRIVGVLALGALIGCEKDPPKPAPVAPAPDAAVPDAATVPVDDGQGASSRDALIARAVHAMKTADAGALGRLMPRVEDLAAWCPGMSPEERAGYDAEALRGRIHMHAAVCLAIEPSMPRGAPSPDGPGQAAEGCAGVAFHADIELKLGTKASGFRVKLQDVIEAGGRWYLADVPDCSWVMGKGD